MSDWPPVDPGFHPGQVEVAKSKARFRVLAAGRRWGKSRLGVWECLKVASEGGRAWWVAPTYPLANEGWRPLRSIAHQWPGATVREVDKEVVLPNGGMVQVRSADEPHRLRGAGLDFVVVDEAAFCKEETWTEALRPALTDKLGRALIISTPKGRNWFRTLWEKAEHRADWDRWQYPTTSNPHIPAGEVQAASLELPSLVWRQEYLAEFVDAAGARYKPDWFRFYTPQVRDGLTWLVKADGQEVDYRDCTRFCTVDLAASLKASADFTVVCSVAAKGADLFVLDIVRRRMEGPDIVPAIRDQMSRHDLRVAHIEAAGFQLALVQEARRDGLPVKELRADRDKVARSLPLEARMEHGTVWFPRDAAWLPDFQRELLAFPVGEHDDQVDALAYAAAVMSQPKVSHDWGAAGEDGLGGSAWKW
jgi:predicted phage terminase large subunit-like protein